MHVNIHGRLGSECASAVQAATIASIVNGLVMVVHLHQVRQVTAAGFGILLDARRQLLEAGLSLSLGGLNLRTRFVLYAWRLQRLFDEWQPASSRSRPLISEAELPVRMAIRSERDALPAQTRMRG
jgi:anti-anti-sigma regulatory factor